MRRQGSIDGDEQWKLGKSGDWEDWGAKRGDWEDEGRWVLGN